jgi:hypothetical protein
MQASAAPDPTVARLVQQLDAERRARITAERRLRVVRLALARVMAQRKTVESKPAVPASPA